jgi:hypothetical protein
MPELSSTASKPKIREALRKIYDEAHRNPPNMNQASDVVRRRIPASRSRIREVLKEDEFARQRRGPGRKRRVPNLPAGKPNDPTSED